MQRFAVVLTDGLPLAEETIKRHYDQSIQLTDDVFLIRRTRMSWTSSIRWDCPTAPQGHRVRERLVCGRASTSVWDWLESAPS